MWTCSPSRCVTRPSNEEGQTPLESFAQRRRCEYPDPRGGQFDGERQPVEAAADLGDVVKRVVRHGESRIDRACPYYEESHGRIVRQLRIITGLDGRRRQRRDEQLLFPAEAQGYAARGQDLYRRAAGQHMRHTVRDGSHEMLAVIEDQEQATVSKREDKALD